MKYHYLFAAGWLREGEERVLERSHEEDSLTGGLRAQIKVLLIFFINLQGYFVVAVIRH